jgi:predicted ribosome quality control (RQC) complex YloA/Tae2 family protein
MEVKIDFTKSAQDNANDYYVRSKRLAHKAEGAQRSIEELEKRLKGEKESFKERSKPALKKVRKREWYERFHWFNAQDGLLAIGGRDAKQNEKLNSDYFEEGDLFFHADIFGASVVILKEGAAASQEAKNEAAQFAASYSSAWDNMQRSVDVYCMRREQVSKATSKGSIGTGSFLLSGEREWFRNTQLGLAAFVEEDRLHVVPERAIARLKPKKYVSISQGKDKKSDAAKKIAHMLDDYDDLDYIMQQTPAGPFSIDLGKQAD